jgi:KDO2-lipid IV(A) lauroyltransferase
MYWFMTSLAALVSRMSSAAIDRLALGIAVLVFDVLRLRRDLVLKNLAIAFPEMPDRERVRVGRESVKNFAITALEFLRSRGTDIAADIEMRGVEHVRAALDQGQGVYVLCFHLGNWEAMGAKISRTIVPAHVLVKKVGGGGMNRFVSELREKNGFLAVKRQKKGDGMLEIAKALKRGEIVGFVMDQARPGEPRLPFFGQPAKTNTSFAAIWRRMQAPIVPAYIHRTAVSQHVIEFFPELKLAVTEDEKADIATHSTYFNEVVATHVKKHPEQYFWMHNRWK